MANQCPRCGGDVKRNYNRTSWRVGGLVGILLVAAFGSFNCEKCGKISQSEFSPEVRNKMRGMSALMVVGAIALVILVVAIVGYY